jgi:transmembrane sensor
MDIRKYESYDTSALLADEDFQRWALHPDAEGEAMWETVFNVYPDKRALAMAARATLQQLQFRQTTFPQERRALQWDAIAAQLDAADTPVLRLNNRRNRWWYSAAAAVLVIGVVLAGWWKMQPAKEVHTTFFTRNGEIKSVTLPDSTVIILNANSTLEYKSSWDNTKDREVWVSGEGYFSVAHQYNALQQRTKFTVHTGNLDVQVWGTTFNVNTRRGTTKVSLNTGKVSIGFPDKKKEPVMMKPGDMIAYSPSQDRITASRVDPAQYSSWQNRELVFNNTSLRDMGNVLEDIYGFKVQIADSATARRTISGRLLAKSDTMLLNTIAAVFNLNISIKDSVVMVAPR